MDAIYISGNTFKVIEDKTAEFSSGRRVKLDCGLDGVKYVSVVSSSYLAPYTTVVIDESDLTASLTDALYGVTQAGETGSFPDHTHEEGGEGQGGVLDGASLGLTFLSLPDTPTTYSETEGLFLRVDSTASGIEFTEAATSFLELTDTPKTYSGSEDLYLRVTTTGIDFSYLSTSGIDDHSHVAYVPWYFGSGTISGTGDIYCNDIYTSSGTVYLGDLKLSNVDGYLFVNDELAEGTAWLESFGVPDDLDDGAEGNYYNDLITKDVYKKRPEIIYNAWNPADKHADFSLSNDDLTATKSTGGWASVRSLISISSGKWYWEVYIDSGDQSMVGVGSSSVSLSSYLGYHAEGWGYNGATGTKYNGGSSTSFGSTYGAGFTIGVALDMGSGKIWWSRNGVWQASGDPATGANPAYSNLTGVVVYPMASTQTGQVTAHFGDTNFGALPLTYTVPEGFLPGVYSSSVGGWNLVGTLENTGSTTFSGLIDTPDTYDNGKYLKSTAVGTEWAAIDIPTFSGTWVETDYEARELVAEYILSSETLDATLSGVQGNTNSRWIIEVNVVDTSGSVNEVRIQFNSDTAANYGYTAFGEDGGAVGGSNNLTMTSAYIGYLLAAAEYAGTNELFLASGKARHIIGADVRRPTRSNSVNGEWRNTADEITTMRLFSTGSLTGSIKVYKRTNIQLPVVSGTGGGTSDVQYFTDLDDTPSTYSGTDGQYLISTGSGTVWATVSGGGGSDGWTYSDELATTSGTILTIDNIPSGVTSVEVMLAGVRTSANIQPPIIQLGDAGGIETTGYDISNELGSATDHTTDGWRTTIDSFHLSTMASYGSLKLRKFIPSQDLWLGEYHFMVSGGNNVRYGSGFKTLSEELTSIALTTPGGSATFTHGSATIRYK